MTHIDYKVIFEQLKKSYQEGEVSALVGAGFSKNISEDDYPSWKDLLSDMVNYLYEQEIDSSYKEYTHINNLPRNKKTYNLFIKKKIDAIITRDGYLTIVERYIEKKGFREAVEIYIEDHTPLLTDDGFIILNGNKKKVDMNNLALHEKLLRCNWENILTTNYDNALEYVAKVKSINRSVVEKSSDLSFSKQRRPIIKIHGSIAHSGTFEFDGRNDKRFIISKGDYEKYTSDHEAFTQFMRITLLKGCFCLFGFSGNDPNFISWIKWVRDVLLKNKNEDLSKQYKVFLLAIDDNVPTKEYQLFYDNHRIAYIPLKSVEVKAILGIDKKEQDIKKIYSAFLNFLQQPTHELTYSELWETVCNRDGVQFLKGHTQSQLVDIESLDKIKSIRKNMRYHKFVWRQDDFLRQLERKSKLNVITLELVEQILIALEDTCYLPSFFNIIPDKIERFLDENECSDLREQYDLLKLRSDTLAGKKSELHEVQSDEFIYENLFRLCFSFELDELKSLLYQWMPHGRWIQRKAMLMTIFDVNFAIELLLHYVDEVTYNTEEKYLTLQLLDYIDRSYPPKYSMIDFENQNLDSVPVMLDELSKKIHDNNDRVLPYGHSSTKSDNTTSKFLSAFRVLQYLIDTGCPIGFNSTAMLNEKSWYNIFKHLYTDFPLPCLFYSTQLATNSEALKRIGQDYAYNDSMRSHLPDFLLRLLKAYDNPLTKKRTKDNILIIASQLLVSVPPAVWQDRLLNIWNNRIKANFKDIDWHNSEYKFVSSGLQYLPATHANAILKDCLEHASGNKFHAWNFIRDLRLKTGRKLSDDIRYSLDAFIDNMSDPDDIIIICCAENYLNVTQKAMVVNKILLIARTNQTEQWPLNAIYCSLRFAKTSKELDALLKSIIIGHEDLFHNGINKYNHFVEPNYYINFSHIKKNVNYNIKWSQKQAVSIYSVLKTKLSQLQDSNTFNMRTPKDWLKFDFVPLLKDMLSFLKENNKHLSNEDDYEETVSHLSSLLRTEYHFNSLEEALSSDDSTTCTNGIDFLMERIEENSIATNEGAIHLLVDRMILKKTGAFMYALSTIYLFLTKHKWEEVRFIEDKILLLLGLYKGSACVDLNINVPIAYYYFVKIALLLNKYCKTPNDDDIKYWLEEIKTKRYNTLRNIVD